MAKPREIFDREREWDSLVRFVTDDQSRGRFGVVYGRRRQGKSWLLERIAARVGGEPTSVLAPGREFPVAADSATVEQLGPGGCLALLGSARARRVLRGGS